MICKKHTRVNRILRAAGMLLLGVVLLFAAVSCTKEEMSDMNDKETASAVTETETPAEVVADGYTAYENGVYTIIQNFTLTFSDELFRDAFNRVTLSYSATEPLVMTLSYTEKGSEKTDSFYLEAGENMEFSGLTENYLRSVSAEALKTVTFSTCTERKAQFTFGGIVTEEYTVYDGKTHYLENDRFKVGIRLMWGGGINYIEDKTESVDGLTNLVNQYDTGRLIQQSYYGTGANGEYTPGSFNNATWSYNPVQGGDQYQNHSRIIDIVVGENSVYIKSQPQDWSLDGQITPSYMENTYTLYDDYIQVDNRFVDFSGWEHPCSTQELPAFYTVSYLDTFVWYNGTKPWTNDALSSRDDLNFWGDAQYSDDCTFPLRESNTETWCAWVSEADDFGIGLYVPNVDRLYAGRHAYNGSKDPMDGACSYVAPINRIQMVSYYPITYSYLMTTGSTEEIRAVFTENKDFCDNVSLHENYMSLRIPDETPDKPADTAVDMSSLDFTKEETYFQISAANNTVITYDGEAGAMKLTASGDGADVQALLSYRDSVPTLNASDYTQIEIVYMLPNNNGFADYGCELFLCTGEQQGAAAGMSVTGSLTCDGEYHTLTLDVGGLDFWSGTINAVRFDYFNACDVDDVMYLKSVTLK